MEETSLAFASELEKKLEGEAETNRKNMTFNSVFKSMVPSIVVGTLAAAGCQKVCSQYTSNPEAITLFGMIAQYAGGWVSYVPIHYFNNRDRLIDEEGRVRWKQYAQDIGSVMASDQVGNKVWALSYGLTSEIFLRSGINSGTAGIFSGFSSGLIYSAFTGLTAPKVNSAIDYIKRKLKGGKK